MNKQRKLILIAAAVGVISVFLPWFSAGAFGFSVHINGFHGWGILTFLAFASAIVISLIGEQKNPLDKTIWFAALISGAVALLAVIITMLSSGGSIGFISAGFSFGIWIALVSSAGIILFAWMYKDSAQDLKSGFDSIKKTISSTPSSTDASSINTNTISELERLSKLKQNGSITEEEFQQLKSKHL